MKLNVEQEKVREEAGQYFQAIIQENIPTKYQFLFDYNHEAKHIPMFPIIGSAGTGKTTLLKYLIEDLDKLKLKYRIVAPTNKAAKVLEDKTGEDASTITSLLYSSATYKLDNELKDYVKDFPNASEEMYKAIEDSEEFQRLSALFSEGKGQKQTLEFVLLMLGKLPEDVKYEGTVSSLRFTVDKNQTFDNCVHGWEALKALDVVIVDEASMVTVNNTLQFVKLGVPLIVIGDDMQLPPIEDRNATNEGTAKTLMELATMKENTFTNLREVMRGDKVAVYGNAIRLLKGMTVDEFGRLQQEKENLPPVIYKEDFLCKVVENPAENRFISALNRTRLSLNVDVLTAMQGKRKVYSYLEDYEPVDLVLPQKGDIVIFERASQRTVKNQEAIVEKFICVGGQGKEASIYYQVMTGGERMVIVTPVQGFENVDYKGQFDTVERRVVIFKKDIMEDDTLDLVKVAKAQFGFCLTAHKAQGSEYDNVCVDYIDYKQMRGDAPKNFDRWFYTSVTRGKKDAFTLSRGERK